MSGAIQRLILAAVLATFAACGSCSDVDKKGDPFKTTEGDAGMDVGSDDVGGGDVGPDAGVPDMDPFDRPEVVVDRDTLQFVGVPVGASAEQTFTVINVGQGALELSGATLVETTTADTGTEFSTGDQWTATATLRTDESLTFSVRYSPGDLEPDQGYVELQTNDPALPDGILRVNLLSSGGEPDISVTQALVFQRVPPVNATTRDTYWQVLEVQNIGGAPLEIADIVLSPVGSPFSFSFPSTANSPPSSDQMAPPPSVDPGESMFVRVYFNPVDDLPATAELVFFTNDPDTPESIVEISGNSGAPCIELSETNEIDFGTASVGFTATRTLIVENCSATTDLNIASFGVCTDDANGVCNQGGVFGINVGTLGAGGIIGPHDTATLITSFTPANAVTSTGLFTIESNDPARSKIEVPLRGEGTDNNLCPTAVADARVSGMTAYSANVDALPLQTIELRGTNSVDTDGTVVAYQWTVLQRPVGSTAVLTPSADVASPQLFLDLAGTYLLELQVVDDQGTQSCGGQALVRINAVPNEDVHIQLVWDTPTDTDQTDANGTDLDLHLLHPNGTWNNLPWDIFWNNPTADWGQVGPADDPSLDIDDTDGAGPENINYTAPQAGLAYAIGVYYYSDNGYGATYATIRVYVQGMLEYEYRDMYLPTTASFWYAATIAWPSGDVFGVNQVTTGFP